MYELKSKNTHVKVHANIVDETTQGQIVQIANHPAIKGLIAIMPDTHAGAGCVIGFTGRFNDAVIPNVVGVDIGCGVTCYALEDLINEFSDIILEGLDNYIKKNVPLGFAKQAKGCYHVPHFKKSADIAYQANEILRVINPKKLGDPFAQMGTLGGGNHFIEIEFNNIVNGYFLTVHSGSRNFGKQVADYYQRKAIQLCKEMKINVPKGLEYLPMGFGGQNYIDDMQVAQVYARQNRKEIIQEILSFLSPGYELDEENIIESTHNYISETDHIVRKGAIRCVPGNLSVIPLDMAAGIIIGEGKGNKDYNLSAPHGAGRVSGRAEMKRKLEAGEVSLNEFKEKMSGVFSTTIDKEHIDESPWAYKQFEDIEEHLKETMNIHFIATPIYNIKG